MRTDGTLGQVIGDSLLGFPARAGQAGATGNIALTCSASGSYYHCKYA